MHVPESNVELKARHASCLRATCDLYLYIKQPNFFILPQKDTPNLFEISVTFEFDFLGSECRFLAAERKQEKKENRNSVGRASRGRRWPCRSKHECEGGGGSHLQQQLHNTGGGGKRLAVVEEVRGVKMAAGFNSPNLSAIWNTRQDLRRIWTSP
ncbi:unnamed protein product [Lactuca saligna]|uniref:Uncharacterized protein n=1 Tax=Lactuca saligna TaxID=75948 RepID=A0AA35YPP4_LACSI|nr:unnamed protein product [Lactuca saligna]